MARFTWGYTGSEMDQLAEWYDWVPFDGNLYDCQKGGILLRVTEGNPAAHTAIVSVSGSQILEASWDWDGREGDSAGNEVLEHGIYDDSWEWFGIPTRLTDEQIDRGIEWGRRYAADDGNGYSQQHRFDDGTDCSSFVLRIVAVMVDGPNGEPSYGIDGADYSEADSGTATPSTGTGARYRAYTKEDGWLDWMEGTYDTGGSGDDFAGVEGHWVYGFEASIPFKVVLMDGSETEWTTQWHEDQAMRGIKIEDARYQVHTVGNGWLKVENGMTDDGAGDDQYAVDMVRVW